MMSSGNKFNYVTNGLIGMYDGIYNKAIGQHDNTITKWYDLSGNNRNFTLSKAAWDNNSLYIPQSDTNNINGTLSSYYDYVTAEFVVQVDYTVNTQYNEACMLMGMQGLGLNIMYRKFRVTFFFSDNSGNINVNKRWSTDYARWKDLGDIFIVQVIIGPNRSTASDTTGWDVYIDGIKERVIYGATGIGANPGINSRSDRKFGGHIYAMRFYNRILSPSELAHNRMLDTDRFKVTMIDPHPYDAELEYIENENGAYINAAFIPSLNTHFDCTVYAYQENIDFLFGCRTGMKNNCYGVLSKNEAGAADNGIRFDIGNLSSSNSGDRLIDTNTIVSFNNLENVYELHYGDYTMTVPTNSLTSTQHFYIFALNNGGTVRPANKFRLYSFKLYDGTTPIRDFIPVRKNNVGYLYDRVNGRLYGNMNTTGSFLLGPDKTT